MRNILMAALAPALLAGCATYQGRDEPEFVHLNQTAAVGPVKVTPLAVLEDSRCPKDVQCVWAGRVRIDAQVNDERREMTLGEPVAVPGGSLELNEVRPAKVAAETIAPGSYRFHFEFR